MPELSIAKWKILPSGREGLFESTHVKTSRATKHSAAVNTVTVSMPLAPLKLFAAWQSFSYFLYHNPPGVFSQKSVFSMNPVYLQNFKYNATYLLPTLSS